MSVRNFTTRVAVAGLLATAAALALVARAGVQDCREGDFGCGHQVNHDSYKNWHSPYDGGSCCKNADCRPTRARQLEDGSWEAWVQGAWRRVPKRAMLESDKLKDGRSHVCSPDYNADVIYCFTPASPKS